MFYLHVILLFHIENRVRQIKPHLHIYGHTHIPIDLELEGVYSVYRPVFYIHLSVISYYLLNHIFDLSEFIIHFYAI